MEKTEKTFIKTTALENWIVEKCMLASANKISLDEYQLSKIRDTIDYAKENSRFYKHRFKNIAGNDLKFLSDIGHVPFTLPSHIEHDSKDFLCVPQRDIKRIVTLRSSGTCGKEKRIFFSEEDLELTVDFFRHGMDCVTDESDRILVLLPGNSFGSIGDLLKKAMDLSGKRCFVWGVLKDVKETAKFIINNRITCIVGIPLQVLLLARVMAEYFKSSISKVLLSTDYVPQVLISELTEKYECKVFTHYGMTEMGYGGGVECEALDGYHMREADIYFEIINPLTGQVLPDGEYGEVVITTLTRKAMPLIRYRTGDMAAFSSKKCSCKTFLKTMKRALGRIDNKVFLPRGYLYMRELDEIIFKFESVVDYRAYLNKDKLIIELAEINLVSKEEENKIKEELESYIIKKFGSSSKPDINVYTGGNFKNNINTMLKRTFDIR